MVFGKLNDILVHFTHAFSRKPKILQNMSGAVDTYIFEKQQKRIYNIRTVVQPHTKVLIL